MTVIVVRSLGFFIPARRAIAQSRNRSATLLPVMVDVSDNSGNESAGTGGLLSWYVSKDISGPMYAVHASPIIPPDT